MGGGEGMSKIGDIAVSINAMVRGFTRDWLPLILSVATVAISWMAYNDAHTASLLSVKPSVDFLTETEVEEPMVGVAVINAGPGPAVVREIAYFVDGKRVKDAFEATTYLGESELDGVRYLDYDVGDILAAGDQRWLLSRKTANAKAEAMNKFIDFLDRRLVVDISYCALRGECWSRCSRSKACGPKFD